MILKTILLAEDNPNDIEFTLMALKECAFSGDTIVVHDGVEVLEYLRYQGRFKDRLQGWPSLILMDLKMPRLDGIEVLKVIKNDPGLKIIPAIMLSGARDDQHIFESYSLGVNAFVIKPVDFNHYIETIRHLVSFWVIINEQPPELKDMTAEC